MSDLFNLPEGTPPLSVRVEKARLRLAEAERIYDESDDSPEGDATGQLGRDVMRASDELEMLEWQLLAETIRERR